MSKSEIKTSIRIEILSKEEQKWYSGNKHKEDIVMLKAENKGWFPSNIIAGTKSGMLSEDTPLSKHTGWVMSNGNSGSKNNLVKLDRLYYALYTLFLNGCVICSPVFKKSLSVRKREETKYMKDVFRKAAIAYERVGEQ